MENGIDNDKENEVVDEEENEGKHCQFQSCKHIWMMMDSLVTGNGKSKKIVNQQKIIQ